MNFLFRTIHYFVSILIYHNFLFLTMILKIQKNTKSAFKFTIVEKYYPPKIVFNINKNILAYKKILFCKFGNKAVQLHST